MPTRCFGPFQIDLVTGELRRHGVRIALQPALATLLTSLASRLGETVTRQELAERLWPAGTHVDYENSLNNSIARLRRIVGPGRIETLSKRGYRLRGRQAVKSRRTVHPKSERAYRLGRHFWGRSNIADLERSVTCFEDAIGLDPDNVRAHAGLADAYILLGDEVSGSLDPKHALGLAQDAARQALALDPDSPEALAAIGMVEWRLNWDWDSAERYLRAAIAARPNYAIGRQYYSWLLQARKRPRESMAEMLRAWELAPLAPFVSTNVAWMLYTGQRFEEAIEHLSDTLATEPYYAMAHLPLGLSLVHCGHTDEAIFWLRRGAALAGESCPYYKAALGYALGSARRVEAARKFLDDSSPFERAMVYVGLGEAGPALDNLEQAHLEGSSHLSYLLVDPLMNPLRRENRFRRLASSLGLD